jgi:PKD repeat protein
MKRAGLIVGFASLFVLSPLLGAEPLPPNQDLIVLLAAGQGETPPEDVVNRVEGGLAVPEELGAGSPTGARLLVPLQDRYSGPLEDPDGPAARLQRYIVLTYPSVVDLEAVRTSLLQNPHVVSAEYNLQLDLSAVPNDPLFPVTDPSGNPRVPDQYQWGSYSLHLPQAWDYNKGHAYVGVVDVGLDTTHPDLRAFHQTGGTTIYDGGNFRPQLSFDYGYPTESPNSVDEGQAEVIGGHPRTVGVAGHGTHVSGIIAATPDNATGVSGGCWNCSLIVSKVSTLALEGVWINAVITQANAVSGINGAIRKGAQVLNLSFGYRPSDQPPNCNLTPQSSFCSALQLAEERDVVMAVASGNDLSSTLDFPASDSRTLAVGGIDSAGNFWNDCSGTTQECGSNYGPDQIVSPAKQILSTFYRGIGYGAPGSDCPGLTDYGLCTGTSMASPYMAAAVGILRSVNPLLSRDNLKDLLQTHLDNPIGWNPLFGRGKPDVSSAVKASLGTAGGAQIANRLTPFFSLYSSIAKDSFYTTVPQMAAAAILDSPSLYVPIGPAVPGYFEFPGAGCQVGPCTPHPPAASVYVFTGDRSPYAGSPLLVPLIRMTFTSSSSSHRDTTYVTDSTSLYAFKNTGYELDGVEGYLYQRCTPEPSCIPPGAVRLYRLYNLSLDDYAIFPESELAQMQSPGYVSTPGLSDVIGYAYPNVDSDGDGLIDGFEALIGTDPHRSDSDCDGVSDGAEVLGYPLSDPLVPNSGAGCVPPTARFAFTCAGLSCSFDGHDSTDNVAIASYAWSFGDSTGASGVSTSHTYAATGVYPVTLTVTDTDGLTSTISHKVSINSDPLPAAESFFTVPRCRILDTRTSTILTSGVSRIVPVAGNCNIPSSAKAVSLVVTAIQPTGGGWIAFYPGNLPVTSPNKASINFLPATSPRSNNAIVRLATDGSGTLAAYSSVGATPGQVHMTVDVDGYFSEATSASPGAQGPFGFQPITPCRVADTRPSSPLVSGVSRTFSIQGACGIPASGVGAVAANTRVVQSPTYGGSIVLYPASSPLPVATDISFVGGINWLHGGSRTALATSTPDLAMRFDSTTSGASAFIALDVNGYFSAGSLLKYHPLAGCRVVDTRDAANGAPSVTAGSTRMFQIQGNCNVPVGAKAVFADVIAVGAGGTGDIRVYPSDASTPVVATTCFDAGESAVGNGTIVPLASSLPDLALYANPSTGTLDVLIEVFGYFL